MYIYIYIYIEICIYIGRVALVAAHPVLSTGFQTVFKRCSNGFLAQLVCALAAVRGNGRALTAHTRARRRRSSAREASVFTLQRGSGCWVSQTATEVPVLVNTGGVVILPRSTCSKSRWVVGHVSCVALGGTCVC